MPDIISFQDAIKETEGEDRALLIGNGFSARYFSYPNLLVAAEFEEDCPKKVLFEMLSTVDFEAVIQALEGAVVVGRAYGKNAHADRLEQDAQAVREALVNAVNSVHPPHKEDGTLTFQYENLTAFLKHFSKVFTLNYDLLLYWVNLEEGPLKDGFGLGDYDDARRFIGPFLKHAHCQIFNLHGGLHLFQSRIGEVYKALNDGTGVMATITHEIAKNKRLPLYVAEGDSKSKLRKINSVGYLRHCYRTLQKTSEAVFVFGHSANENDAHIYHAIFGSRAKKVYFGIFQPTKKNVRSTAAELARYKRLGGDRVPYSFFDSETAQVWDGPPGECEDTQ